MEVSGKPCILHARAQAAFASILIPGLPEPYRKSEPKECCVLFLLHNRYPAHRERRNDKTLYTIHYGTLESNSEEMR